MNKYDLWKTTPPDPPEWNSIIEDLPEMYDEYADIDDAIADAEFMISALRQAICELEMVRDAEYIEADRRLDMLRGK